MAKFSVEERELDEQDTLAMLKKGVSLHEIAGELGRSVQYIANTKKKLIGKGLITEDEIEEYTLLAYDNKVHELLIAQKTMPEIMKECRSSKEKIIASIERLKNSGRLPEGMVIIQDKNKERKDKKKQKKEQLLKLLLQGNINTHHLLEELQIGNTTLNRYVEELIAEGKLDRETWNNRNNQNSEVDPAKQQEVLDLLYSRRYNKFEIAAMTGVYVKYVTWVSENLMDKEREAPKETEPPTDSSGIEEQIIEKLRKGFTYKYIAKVLEIDPKQLTAIIQDLKKKGKITQTEIEKCRQQRKEQDRKEILIYLRRGFNYTEIMEEIEGALNTRYIILQVRSLIADGLITQEEIERYKDEAPQGKIEIASFVLEQLRLGKSYNEIIVEDKTGYLSLHRVMAAKEYLVSSGQTTDEEIEMYRKNRESGRLGYVDSLVLGFLREGKTVREIIESDDTGLLTEGKVVSSKERLIKSGKITKRQIEMYKEQAEKKKQERIDKFVLQQLLLGKTQQEIVNADEEKTISEVTFLKSKKRLLKSGKITPEILSQARKKRNQDNRWKNASKTNSVSDFEKEVIAMIKEGFSRDEIASHFNLTLATTHVYVKTIEERNNITQKDVLNFREKAKEKYEKLRLDARDDSKKSEQMEFFKLLMFYSSHGRKINSGDLTILENCILINPNLLQVSYLRFVIMQYIKMSDYNRAMRFINECINIYEESKYVSLLREFKKEMDEKIKIAKIFKLSREKGLSSSQIADTLNMHEVDVISILKNPPEDPDSDGR